VFCEGRMRPVILSLALAALASPGDAFSFGSVFFFFLSFSPFCLSRQNPMELLIVSQSKSQSKPETLPA